MIKQFLSHLSIGGIKRNETFFFFSFSVAQEKKWEAAGVFICELFVSFY